MIVTDPLNLRGTVRALVFDGEVGAQAALAALDDVTTLPIVSDQIWTNLVTNIGRAQMTALIVGESTVGCAYMALSTSVVVPGLADTVGTIVDRITTSVLTVKQSYLSYYQRYVAYFTTASFATTGINTEALLDAASTAAATNLWADAVVNISKSAVQSLIIDHRIYASTGS